MREWHPTIVLSDFVYVRLIGLIWKCNGLIKTGNLEIDTGELLNQIYLTQSTDRPFVIDTKGVFNVTDRAWDNLFKSFHSTKRELIFINCSALEEKIQARYKEYCKTAKITQESTLESIAIYNIRQTLSISHAIIQQVNSKIQQKIAKFIGECFEENDNGQFKYLPSTPIKANGEFNASLLISDPEKFTLICLHLADLVQELINKHQIGDTLFPPCLLAVNLRACPFVAAVSMLLKVNFETIDHFGPISKMLDEDRIGKKAKFYEFIYFGDFTVGGTEIKISQTYAQLRQCKLNHAVVLGSLHEPRVFKNFILHPLVLFKRSQYQFKI